MAIWMKDRALFPKVFAWSVREVQEYGVWMLERLGKPVRTAVHIGLHPVIEPNFPAAHKLRGTRLCRPGDQPVCTDAAAFNMRVWCDVKFAKFCVLLSPLYFDLSINANRLMTQRLVFSVCCRTDCEPCVSMTRMADFQPFRTKVIKVNHVDFGPARHSFAFIERCFHHPEYHRRSLFQASITERSQMTFARPR